MTSFKKTYIKAFAKPTSYSGTDAHYWKNYEFPVSVKEFSAIDCIDVSPVEPYYIAVTTGPKVDLYHQQTAQVWRSLTRFQKGAYGGRFRADGQLLVAGSEEAEVKLFNFRQKQLLRIFKGHTGPVHRVDFVRAKPQVVSFSDDRAVVLWDVSEEKAVVKFQEHEDFVRAGAASPTSEHIVVSGSYDHTIKVWDARTGSAVVSFDHGSPVESVLCYPSGSVIASAGGADVKVWDSVGGKLLTSLSPHHKTVTCLSLASGATRLLSASLDRHVRVHHVVSYATLTAMQYPAPVLACAVAPGDSTLVTGMLSGGAGLVSFQQRSTRGKDTAAEGTRRRRRRRTDGGARRSLRMRPGDEVVAPVVEWKKMSGYNRMLAKFEYSRAFDSVMHPGVEAHVTIAVLRELIRRSGLASAMAGRDAKTLSPLFRFLTRNIRNSASHRILFVVAGALIDIYGERIGEDSRLFDQFRRLNDELEMDLLVSRSGVGLMGAIEMLLSTSELADPHSGNLSAAVCHKTDNLSAAVCHKTDNLSAAVCHKTDNDGSPLAPHETTKLVVDVG